LQALTSNGRGKLLWCAGGVKAQALGECISVGSAPTIDFGAYDSVSLSPLSAVSSGKFLFKCKFQTGYEKVRICIDVGLGTPGWTPEGGDFENPDVRLFSHPDGVPPNIAGVVYNLYADAAHTQYLHINPVKTYLYSDATKVSASDPDLLVEVGPIYGKINLTRPGRAHSYIETLHNVVYPHWYNGDTPPECGSSVNSLTVISTAKINVLPSCHVKDNVSIDFGEISALKYLSGSSAGHILVQCNTDKTARIAFGENDSNGKHYMKKIAGDELIEYQLFKDPSHNSLWDEAGIFESYQYDTWTWFSFYAAIPPQIVPAAGKFQDKVLVEIEY